MGKLRNKEEFIGSNISCYLNYDWVLRLLSPTEQLPHYLLKILVLVGFMCEYQAAEQSVGCSGSDAKIKGSKVLHKY